MLGALGLTREQLVDLGILVGTDFNAGIKGIGPKKALALLRRHGSIERMPVEVRAQVEDAAVNVRPVYLAPEVTDDYATDSRPCDVDGIVRFLCEERIFSQERVRAALQRAFPEGR